jgi:acetyltransferase
MLTIEQLTAASAAAELAGLIELLVDSVASGASVGFLPPLALADARDYWADVIAGVEEGTRVLLIARQDDRIVGTVQLEFARKPNARHRAEVQKLLVHTTMRRQGLGRALMAAIEDAARQAGRTLLVLDTRQGDPSEQLYRAEGYTLAGTIPAYARNGDGGLDATALYYKLLA